MVESLSLIESFKQNDDDKDTRIYTNDMFGGSQSWPQLVGMPVAQAEAFIRTENPREKINEKLFL